MAMQVYGTGANSSVGTQFNTSFYAKKALVEAAKEMYFSQLADVTSMPRNFGKTIKKYHYLPILDDRNINDQGINASGVSTDYEVTITITNATGQVYYAVGNGVSAGAALTAAQTAAEDLWKNLGVFTTNYATTKAALIASGTDWEVSEGTAVSGTGNLYGSSKDIGYITGKLPTLSETGGRVNRVGFKRIDLEGSLEKYGFFLEYTQESLDFDTDEELQMHMTTECVKAANEIAEDLLQMDLLNAAGVTRFTGGATKVSELTGEASGDDSLVYDDLVKLSVELDNNRTPKSTKVITGSRMIDTKVVNAARYMYCGSELLPTLMKLTDYHSERAFVPVAQYGAAGTVARGEHGSVGDFRIIIVPEMMKWGGVGASVSSNGGFYETGGKYDVFPMLVVGDGSFSTIGFQTDGKTVKFSIKSVKPSDNYSSLEPFGETGFHSIKWYYGYMTLRSERIALIKTVAEV